MTEEKYREEIENLIYDAPTSNPPNWPKWKLPSRKDGESYESHLVRLRQFKAGYFEHVKKLEDGMSLSWL
jgi:hypothetical protein